jgi:hypothetical protein
MVKRDRTWRGQAVPLVAQCIESGREQGLEGRELVRYCNRSFPWGQRAMWPYTVWKSEVKRQLGMRHDPVTNDLPGQQRLFD